MRDPVRSGRPRGGTIAALGFLVGVRKLEELVAFQLALQFKLAVYKLVRSHPAALRDFRYRDQLFDAASGGEANVAEGFDRYRAAEFRQFLSYAKSSISEAKRRVVDGVHREYFTELDAQEALTLGNRAAAAATALHRSLGPFIKSPKRGP